MERWSGRVAVVTGASAGIGAAASVALANAGMRVLGLARRTHLVEALQSQVVGSGSIVSHACDVSQPESVSAAFRWAESELGGVHVLVSNAGVHTAGHITDVSGAGSALSEAALLRTLDVNLRGAVLCARQAVAAMTRGRVDGHIIIVNSIAGHYVPFSPLFNVYAASKHGVTALAAALATELAHAHSNIKLTSLSPGLVSTDMSSAALPAVSFRPLQPRDVADAMLYALATPPHVNVSELTLQPVAEIRM